MTDQPSITCPRCGMTSYSRMDVDEGYCGRCHAWTSHSLGEFVHLPPLTRDEADLLYSVLDQELQKSGRVPIASTRWSMLNSLRTAVGEAKVRP